MDVAASIQAVTEDAMLAMGRELHRQTGMNKLVMARRVNSFFFNQTGIASAKLRKPLGAYARYVSSRRSNFARGLS